MSEELLSSQKAAAILKVVIDDPKLAPDCASPLKSCTLSSISGASFFRAAPR